MYYSKIALITLCVFYFIPIFGMQEIDKRSLFQKGLAMLKSKTAPITNMLSSEKKIQAEKTIVRSIFNSSSRFKNKRAHVYGIELGNILGITPSKLEYSKLLVNMNDGSNVEAHMALLEGNSVDADGRSYKEAILKEDDSPTQILNLIPAERVFMKQLPFTKRYGEFFFGGFVLTSGYLAYKAVKKR